MEEEEEGEEEQEDKEPVEPPADKVYHVIGSLKDKNKPKPGFVQDVVLVSMCWVRWGMIRVVVVIVMVVVVVVVDMVVSLCWLRWGM